MKPVALLVFELTVTSYNVDLNFNPNQLFKHLSKEKEKFC